MTFQITSEFASVFKQFELIYEITNLTKIPFKKKETNKKHCTSNTIIQDIPPGIFISFEHCCGISIVDFEQVNVSWVISSMQCYNDQFMLKTDEVFMILGF